MTKDRRRNMKESMATRESRKMIVVGSAGVLPLILYAASCGAAPARTTTTVPPTVAGSATVQASPSPAADTPVRTTTTPTHAMPVTATASHTPGIRAEGSADLFANFGYEAIPEGYIDLDTGAVGTPVTGDLV